MAKFLEDFPKGIIQKRYVPGELPSLPFSDKEFDLALCSQLLFLYTDNLSLEFHLRSLEELCRVSNDNPNISTYGLKRQQVIIR